MRLQILSDLHLETEAFEPEPAPGAELLVLAGDIDSTWQGYARFAGWPVPVLVVPGNHEFDRRELRSALPAFRDHCARLGLRVLECDEWVHTTPQGRRVRFLGTVRWSDFEVFGPALQAKALKAASYFQKVMQATCDGQVFDAAAVRGEGLACRAWLQAQLAPEAGPAQPLVDAGAQGVVPMADTTVVITHFAPSLYSADPRYGHQPTTASFCNADEDLLAHADAWVHGHVHWRSDYRWPRASGGHSRVICQARGLLRKGESEGFEPLRLFEV
ncbi:MAG: metallophosphoesterase [Betaproteobacteria bacterium]